MKNRSKSLSLPQARPNAMKSLSFLMVALIALLIMSSCNTQKTTTNSTDQRRPAQGERSGPPSIDEIFAMDTNKDGKLALSEVEGPLARDFSRVDTDGDGFITRTELENAPKPERRQGPPRNNR